MSSYVIKYPSPTGEELQMAQYMQSELQKISLDVTWQEIEDAVLTWSAVGRAQAAARLMFNATWILQHRPRRISHRHRLQAARRGQRPFIYGLGILQHEGRPGLLHQCVKAQQPRSAPER